ncbi:hypothetical protein [Pseudomonas aeruginosa]|uniref:hypothetical protein n=1 Tax=Pseudomonas aeruginosa TaxID=287 RepID=UPI000EB3F4D9|nr:hypothetical protein [Pseudomonas aeruginosa]
MANTHGWSFQRPLNEQQWVRTCRDIEALLKEPSWTQIGDKNGVELDRPEAALIRPLYTGAPTGLAEAIEFNGVGNESREAFYLTPETLTASIVTDQQRYEPLVMASMLILAYHKPGTALHSTANEQTWAPAWLLARHVLRSQHPDAHESVDSHLADHPGRHHAAELQQKAAEMNCELLDKVDAWLQQVEGKAPEDQFAQASLNSLKLARRQLAEGTMTGFDARYAVECLEGYMRDSRFVEPLSSTPCSEPAIS